MDFPHDFILRTRQFMGDHYPDLEKALQKEAPVSIRINPDKPTPARSLEKVMWCETGYYLERRPSFTFDPLFHAGSYYVQEASSMFLEQAIRQYIRTSAVCLDLCAAPGGKSTHLASILPEKSLLVSNEIIRSRSAILAENLAKWGSPHTIITNNDPKEIGMLTHMFDLIIADLPCSGEGMFRKDMDSRNEWSVAHIQLCATRQRRIIHDVWDALKPGGILLYSTCTFNTEENEENIRYLTETFHAEVLPIPVHETWKISGAVQADFPVCRFFPHLTKGEGFFIAVLRKQEEKHIRQPVGKHRKQPAPAIPATIRHWLTKSDEYQFTLQANAIRAIPDDDPDIRQQVSGRLRVIADGILLGEIKGKDLIPSPALALNTQFDRTEFPNVELPWKEAIRFLQKETPVLPPDIPKGFVVVTYRNQPLGFVKNIGNRVNNLYPQEWRIRSRHVPESEPDIL